MNLRNELNSLLNRHSVESGSDTPDFILANYLMRCLDAFNEAVLQRSDWYRAEEMDAYLCQCTNEDCGWEGYSVDCGEYDCNGRLFCPECGEEVLPANIG